MLMAQERRSIVAPGVLDALKILKPQTVIRWHRAGFRAYWRWKSRLRGGRPKAPADIRQLIRDMSVATRLWGRRRQRLNGPENGVEFAVRPVQICFGGGGLNLPTEVLTYRRRGGIPSRQLEPECGSSLRHLDSGTESPVCRVENASLKVGRTPPHGATDHPWAVRLIVKLKGAAGLEACAAEPVSSNVAFDARKSAACDSDEEGSLFFTTK